MAVHIAKTKGVKAQSAKKPLMIYLIFVWGSRIRVVTRQCSSERLINQGLTVTSLYRSLRLIKKTTLAATRRIQRHWVPGSSSSIGNQKRFAPRVPLARLIQTMLILCLPV